MSLTMAKTTIVTTQVSIAMMNPSWVKILPGLLEGTCSLTLSLLPVPLTLPRFCKANAEIAHNLLHWKRALNDWVIDRIKADGHMDPDKLAERTNWSKKQLRKFANEIVDGWEAEREVKSLYHDFKLNLDHARNSKQGR
jgi:hypothetical protein